MPTPREQATSLLEKIQDGKFPVPVVELAKSLGIDVFEDPDYPKDKSGHLRIHQGKPEIILNANHPSGRKRFTIAHEIGHFLSDKDYIELHGAIDRDGDAKDPSYRARERRANEFAAELLMPEPEFVQQWIDLGSIEETANYFGVSKAAACFRAANLGLAAAA